ncbi:hypothetical protein [Timonella sp. A28]|uniref:hypothetical protein n=1 Tax=Timonella sp. A28 TaxID=3442640 RepID=UPI003EBB7BBF
MATYSETTTVKRLLDLGVSEEAIKDTGAFQHSDGTWLVNGRKGQMALYRLEEKETQTSFTKIQDNWGIRGRGLVTGKEVVVSKRDGSKKEVVVGEVVSDEDGVQTAHIAPKPRATNPVKYCAECGIRIKGSGHVRYDMSGIEGLVCRKCSRDDHLSFA